MDDFFIRALLAGIGVAIVAGPLGCFIIWRKMAYFGDTLAHAALLGVALALLSDVNMTLTVFVVSVGIALSLLGLQKKANISSDALLGLLSHSALALGMVALAFLTWIRVDINSLLFGDILAVSKLDVLSIWFSGAIVLIILVYFWRPLFAATLNDELAKAEGLEPEQANYVFLILMACLIAFAMKIVGVLLITALLVIPAASARRFASGPETMAIIAACCGGLSVIGGLFSSLHLDTPAGPSIVVIAFLLFLISISSIGSMLARLFIQSRE